MPLCVVWRARRGAGLDALRRAAYWIQDRAQQYPVGSTDPTATTARLWLMPYSGAPEVVAKVDQSADGGPTDVDGRPPGSWRAWESSGIVDASAAFGRGAFLINVQAHTLWIERATTTTATASPTSPRSAKADNSRCCASRDAEQRRGAPCGAPLARRRLAAVAAGSPDRRSAPYPTREPQPLRSDHPTLRRRAMSGDARRPVGELTRALPPAVSDARLDRTRARGAFRCPGPRLSA